MGKHCPVTGRSLIDCDCGACDGLDEALGGDEGDEADEADDDD